MPRAAEKPEAKMKRDEPAWKPADPLGSRLSSAQRRLWFLEHLHPSTAAYNIPVSVRLRGELNVEALIAAIVVVLTRHEILRARFAEISGEPQQWFEDPPVRGSNVLPIIDLSAVYERAGESVLQRRLTEEARKPFDLLKDQLIRTLLFRLGAHDHVLFVNMHHIVSDAFSFELFFREMSFAYEAYPNSPELPILPLQYVDYAVAEAGRLSGKFLQTKLDFWRNELANAPELLELPADTRRRVASSPCGERQAVQLSKHVTEQLQRFCREQMVTPFMLGLCLFKVLLYRLTGQSDILVGAPITGRDRPGTKQVIGFFSNTIVLRSRMERELPFCKFLQNVRATTLRAFANRELPFERLVEELQPERHGERPPIVQVMFDLQPSFGRGLALAGVDCRAEVVDTGTAKFDLGMTLVTDPQGWRAEIEYDTALFTAKTAMQWLGHFEVLLAQTLTQPDTPIGRLPLLSDAERRRVVVEFNETPRAPVNLSLIELFERQVIVRPEATALSFKNSSLTYAELNTRANQLAHELRTRGVGVESKVVICMDQKPEALVAILAVLKSGGAFVPIDPRDPDERLRMIMADAEAQVVLSEEKMRQRIGNDVPLLCLDSLHWTKRGCGNIEVAGDNDSLAYVIYTSGSTGKPKGVQITRASLLNHNLAIGAIYALCPDDRVLQHASLSFDVSLEEIWPTWLHGGAIVMSSPGLYDDVAGFLRFVEREHVTVLNLPTALWHAVVEELPRAVMPSCVRLVVIGGERASAKHVRAWQRHVGETVQLMNAYGPTEATITSTVFVANGKDTGELPIGRPIANTQVFILDELRQPVPIGIAGELYIGGPGVARGYLNRPDLTAERFVESPLEEWPGRLYRTGDLARFLDDGNVEFIGRADHQVKIRGFRIELEEIESHLREHRKIRNVAAVVCDAEGGARLAACVEADHGLTADELRAFLEARLPHYMMPSTFVMLEKLPLNSNGKVNRKALPPLNSAVPDAAYTTVDQPRDLAQRALAEIWLRLLGLPTVGIHDNFFRVGGHSLLAMRLVSRIQDAFQIDFHMKSIFEMPTIEQLAKAIERRMIEQVQQLTDEEAEQLCRQAA
jgi:amino acid adenylation domain-containing protein